MHRKTEDTYQYNPCHKNRCYKHQRCPLVSLPMCLPFYSHMNFLLCVLPVLHLFHCHKCTFTGPKKNTHTKPRDHLCTQYTVNTHLHNCLICYYIDQTTVDVSVTNESVTTYEALEAILTNKVLLIWMHTIFNYITML
jgi:hypothetical protein